MIQDWLETGGLPDDVDLYSVTTFSSPLRPKWPPEDWLRSEDWEIPVIMDDEDNTFASYYGMRGSPFFVVLDGENTNLARVEGELDAEGLGLLVEITRTS